MKFISYKPSIWINVWIGGAGIIESRPEIIDGLNLERISLINNELETLKNWERERESKKI